VRRSRTSSPSAATTRTCIVNTHATFRWRHGLFSAFDFDQIRVLQPDLFICLVDNIEVVHHRLHREHDIDATLKDCMVWREEEILATELMSQAIPGSARLLHPQPRPAPGHAPHRSSACSPAGHEEGVPVFPMSHVVDMPEVLAEIDASVPRSPKHFITFDPGDVDEKLLLDRADRRPARARSSRGRAAQLRRDRRRAGVPIRSACARCSTSPATSTARSTCATSSSSISPT
jgi:hypothetical protein